MTMTKTITMEMRGRPVTHEEGEAAIRRLIHSHFKSPDSARVSIPVRADDDDVVASDYAIECQERDDDARARIAELVGLLEKCEARHGS